VTRSILEAHRGHIRYEPRSGGGSRFVIELPLPAPASDAS
jgi:signal transduction histidine kinase